VSLDKGKLEFSLKDIRNALAEIQTEHLSKRLLPLQQHALLLGIR
jgi:hypothetical protein